MGLAATLNITSAGDKLSIVITPGGHYKGELLEFFKCDVVEIHLTAFNAEGAKLNFSGQVA